MSCPSETESSPITLNAFTAKITIKEAMIEAPIAVPTPKTIPIKNRRFALFCRSSAVATRDTSFASPRKALVLSVFVTGIVRNNYIT